MTALWRAVAAPLRGRSDVGQRVTSLVGVADVSAHRLDEYLQAARLAIDPGYVQLELDLTPGIALAEEITTAIDRNRDGSLSEDEQWAYGRLVVSALTLEVDGTPVAARLSACRFPDAAAMRRGAGTIRLHSTASLPSMSIGDHQLLFRNSHHRDSSVYLANALVPESDRVAIGAQRRAGDQHELTIDYALGATPAIPRTVWLFGSLAAATALLALVMRTSPWP